MKLWRHRPGAWYWECEKETMLYLHLNSGLSLSLISKEYLIPYSTLKTVWAENQTKFEDGKRIKASSNEAMNMQILLRNTSSIIEELPLLLLTLLIFGTKIKHDLGMTIECKNIRAILKNKLNFSFKKWSSRPINIESQRLNLIRTLHAIEFISIWESDTLIINIELVLFSNKIKKKYYWIQRERWSNVGNILFSGSKSLTVPITSNIDWFAMFLLMNNNASKFIDFMKKLLLWVKFDLNYDLKNTLMILDNLSIHRAKCTLNLLSKSEASFSFIPAYTPKFAPIELIFNILKMRLIKQSSSRYLYDWIHIVLIVQ